MTRSQRHWIVLTVGIGAGIILACDPDATPLWLRGVWVAFAVVCFLVRMIASHRITLDGERP